MQSSYFISALKAFELAHSFLWAGMISYTKSSASTPTLTAGKLLSRPPATTDKPRGAALARVLKVGDRVRRGPDWDRLNRDLVSLPPL